jgi:hypothetical protein
MLQRTKASACIMIQSDETICNKETLMLLNMLTVTIYNSMQPYSEIATVIWNCFCLALII